MDTNEEKKLIYDLMKEIIEERRKLSEQYFGLKKRLDSLGINIGITTISPIVNHPIEKKLSNFEKEQIAQKDYYYKKNKSSHYVSFDRISKNVVYILKNSPIPLSNKEIWNQLNNEFEMKTSYSNFTCNILPRMNNNSSIPVEKAYRGYWQYRLH